MSELADLIRAKRTAEGLTLREAGAASGVAFSTLARIEAGASPSLKVDRQIRHWLNGEATLLPLPPMTLLDWFAGQALPAFVEIVRRDPSLLGEPVEKVYEAAAAKSFMIADAMLAERKRRS